VADYFLEFSNKEGSSVRDYAIRKAINALYITEEDFAKVNSCYSRIIR
jgi:hypothetical protein